jgi:RHS repeat-associated protein
MLLPLLSLLHRLQEGRANADAWQRFDALYRPLLEAWLRRCSVPEQEVDALGRRVSENAGTPRDLYYSAEWQVIEERTSGTVRTQHIWSPVYVDAIILRDRDSDNNGTLDERLYVTQDASRNMTALVNLSGVQEPYAYTPYGEQVVLDASWGSRSSSSYDWIIGHQGLRYESLTGLYHNWARELSPTLRRFVSVDPIGLHRVSYQYLSMRISTRGRPQSPDT